MIEPLVNVIIPVYKIDSNQLVEAVKSILNQTYSNIIIIIIIDEGSDNISKGILKKITDPRLVIEENGENRGIPFSLNKGIELSEGKYIFRMDGDDVCLPDRIEKQVMFMESHQDVDLVSTYAETFGDAVKLYRSSTTNEKIMAELIWKNPIVHSTVCFRSSTLKEKGIRYTPGSAEDYRLWIEMLYGYDCKAAVIPEVLLKYRIHQSQLTQIDKKGILNKDKDIIKMMAKILGLDFNDKEINLFCKCRAGFKIGLNEVFELKRIEKKIICSLPESVSKRYARKMFNKVMIKSVVSKNTNEEV